MPRPITTWTCATRTTFDFYEFGVLAAIAADPVRSATLEGYHGA